MKNLTEEIQVSCVEGLLIGAFLP